MFTCACVCVSACLFRRSHCKNKKVSFRYTTIIQDQNSRNLIISLGSPVYFLTIRVLKKISSFRCGIFVWRSIAQTFPELSFALALFLALSCRFAAFGFHNFVAFRLRIFIYILFRFHCVSLSVNLNCPLFGKFKIRNSPHHCQNIVEKAHTILIVLHSSRPPAVSLTKYYMIYPRSWCIYFVQNKYK